jgi:hypothetical protein
VYWWGGHSLPRTNTPLLPGRLHQPDFSKANPQKNFLGVWVGQNRHDAIALPLILIPLPNLIHQGMINFVRH